MYGTGSLDDAPDGWTDDDGLGVEGMTPTQRHQRVETGQHTLEAVPGRVPANPLVWECEFCGKRSTGTGYFRRNPCEANPDGGDDGD